MRLLVRGSTKQKHQFDGKRVHRLRTLRKWATMGYVDGNRGKNDPRVTINVTDVARIFRLPVAGSRAFSFFFRTGLLHEVVPMELRSRSSH